MLGTPITNGFTYRQAAIPTGAVAGQTWQQLNSSGVPILEYVYDGSFWRITGGRDGQQRVLYPVASVPATTGGVTGSVINTLGRRFSFASGAAAGTGKNVFNNNAVGAIAAFGVNNQASAANLIDFTKPVEIFTSWSMRKTGVLRWYLTSNSGLGAASDLDGRGFGVLIDLVSGAVTLHLHNGTSLFTQSAGTLSWWASTTIPNFSVELCWDGASRFGAYLNGIYLGGINQSISQPANPAFLLHLGFDQAVTAPITQFFDHYYIQTIGGY